METAASVLKVVEDVLFVLLAVVAIRMYRQRPDSSRAWLAATFVVLAAVAVAGQFIPSDSDAGWVTWASKVLISVLVLFPYFLYHFTATFSRPRAWLFPLATAVTAILSVGILVFPTLPGPGEPISAPLLVYAYLLLLQWVGLSLVVAVRLWRFAL